MSETQQPRDPSADQKLRFQSESHAYNEDAGFYGREAQKAAAGAERVRTDLETSRVLGNTSLRHLYRLGNLAGERQAEADRFQGISDSFQDAANTAIIEGRQDYLARPGAYEDAALAEARGKGYDIQFGDQQQAAARVAAEQPRV